MCCWTQINTTSDERDRSNPFRFANIGVEKFLELNSEQNHDDYCLAYVFTDRDFDDGVLGLAWVGAPAGKLSSRDEMVQMKRFCLWCCCVCVSQGALEESVRRTSCILTGRRSLWTPGSSRCRTTPRTCLLKSRTSPSLMRSDTTSAPRWESRAVSLTRGDLTQNNTQTEFNQGLKKSF